MRFGGILVAATVLALGTSPAAAQTLGKNLTPLQVGVACAPPPVLMPDSPDAIRVLAGADAQGKGLLGDQEQVVLSAGSARGLAVGQEYFVRRLIVDHEAYGKKEFPAGTIGWVTIVAANEKTAIAAIERTCRPIQTGDFIEPFARPNPPPGVETASEYGQLDFSTLGKVLYGSDEHHSLTVGDFVLIDEGADRGMTEGGHVALYRDPNNSYRSGLPLVAIGEAAVVSVGPTMSLVRVNQAHTEVRTGDYVVPKR